MQNSLRSRAGLAITAAAAGLLALGSVPALPTPALGQGPPSVCQPRDHLLTWLHKNYGEVPSGVGVANGRLVELLTSPDGASWTIIQTAPDGISCMMIGGEGWRTLPRPPEGPAV
jgi:hypothetical protein